MSQDSPPRMKIARLFSGESPMNLALTTPYENSIFRGVVMSLGTPRRMKMTFIAAPPQGGSRDALQRVGSEVVCYLVPRACRGVGPRYPHQGFATEYPDVGQAPRFRR